MEIKIGKVVELFSLQGHGLVVAFDTTYDQLPDELAVTVGSSVVFRDADEIYLVAEVKGIEHCDPWSPRHPFAILLPSSVTKNEVRIGSEVWSTAQLSPDR